MMHDWRQENSEALTNLATEAERLGYNEYAEFCRLRKKGLRGESSEKLSSFVQTMKERAAEEQRGFVDWILTYSFHNSEVIEALPALLKRELIGPVIAGWTAVEPENPKALRWHEDERALLVAARAQPPDEIAIGRYATVILARIDYATHEPDIYRGESAKSDVGDLQTTLDLLNTIPTADFFEMLREEALLLKLELQKQIEKAARSR
jgi:hypothetical protein